MSLITALIFIPYVLLMTGLGVYIWRTGQPPAAVDGGQADDGQDPEDDIQMAA